MSFILTFLCFQISFGLVQLQGNPKLLFANKRDIRIVDLQNSPRNSSVVIRHLQDAAILDFYYKEEYVFWSDINLEMIKRAKINVKKNGKQVNETSIVTTGLISPDGLACDWIGRKLYWSDSEINRIEVANLDGVNRKVLFWQNLYQPRAVALVPMKGLMFWTDWGDVPKIERASMDGDHKSRIVIVSKKIQWPNGLTIDYQQERVYFADAQLKIIESMRYDGSERKSILRHDLTHPFALTVHGDFLFWSDWHTRAIHYCDKYNGKNVSKLIGGNLSPMDIHAYVPERQPSGFTACNFNNGGCSHLCLLSSSTSGYSCACPTGVRLLGDKKTCADGAQNILLLTRRSDIRRISLDTDDFTDVILPLKGISHAIAIDYDPVDGYMYWTDDGVYSIRRAKLDGSDQQELITREVFHPDGIAVDWISRNLYWTDTGTDRLEVARLNGTSRRILISENLDKPRAIAIDPEQGYMYWTDWGADARIEKAYMDGSHRKVIVSKNLGWPNGLSIDYEQRKLYWGDAKLDSIEMSDLNGKNRKSLLSDNLPHIFGFSLFEDYIYWTDWQGRNIERVNKYTGKDRQIIINHLPDVMGLKAISVKGKQGTNPCATNYDRCSHLCLSRPNQGYVCACPMGLELDSDNRSCIVPEAFLLFSRQDDIRRLSLKVNRDDTLIPISNIIEVSALDFMFSDDQIYWTDSSEKKISRAFINGSNVEHIIEFGLEYPEGMAVDWVARNIYWSDIGFHRIEVASLDGKSRKVLIWENLETPRSLVLDPMNGYMYWSDWGTHLIEKAALDGSQRQALINRVDRANGLTIDYTQQKLYWADSDSNSIESADLNGRRRKKLIDSLYETPYSLTVYQDHLYWADWNSRSIERANKTNGDDRIKIQSNNQHIMNLLVFHGSRQPGWNECALDNGGCSHLCLAMPHKKKSRKSYSFVCACPTHYKLSPNNKTCEAPSSFLLFSQKNKINQMLVDHSVSIDIILPIARLKNVKAIDYDPVSKFLYWIDDRNKSIRRSYLNGTKATVVVSSKNRNIHPYDIAIDVYGRLLYWTCALTNTINISRLSDLSPVGSIFKESGQKPRSIAINPIRGYIFWANVGQKMGIERADLDGTHHQTLFNTGLKSPTGLTVDVQNNLLFWADDVLNRIESSDIRGGNRTILYESQNLRPLALTVHKLYLFWIDKDTKTLERVNKLYGNDHRILKSRVSQLSDLIAVTTPTKKALNNHECFYEEPNVARCSHICFIDTMDGWGRSRCSCPIGLVLRDDDSSCGPPPECESDKFSCRSDGSCIPLEWRCDGNKDCNKDRSDEEDCSVCSRLSDFKCDNGQCIPSSKRCDGRADCSDQSDEQNCCYNQFQCQSGSKQCLDYSLVCDGTTNCLDGSDESYVNCKLVAVGGKSKNNDFGNSNSKDKEIPAVKSTQYNVTIVISSVAATVIIIFAVCWICKRRSRQVPTVDYETETGHMSKPLNNKTPSLKSTENIMLSVNPNMRIKYNNRNICPSSGSDQVQSSCNIPFERNYPTGTSSSSSNCMTLYRVTGNPPPSPVTERSVPNFRGSGHCSSCAGGPAPSTTSTLQSYKHHRIRNKFQAPPPTPCNTDYFDDSDVTDQSMPVKRMYHTMPHRGYRPVKVCNHSNPYPPPSTPQSNYLSDNCFTSGPPSPETERSFRYLENPPPSPVLHVNDSH